ncbi:valine--tRNA ligase [Candidatus Saccharibacteria bacterium]|nr:valine--tRNA ligase [Candidatus Saccharibacteria bacterium]
MRFEKVYEPQDTEAKIYALWEASGVFKAGGRAHEHEIDGDKTEAGKQPRETWSTVMPPPNANGNLHIGHGFEMGLKDILARHYRLYGRDVVYIPGADHAGFETWVVYERALEHIDKTRFDFSREELYQQVWDFVANTRHNMEIQIRMLGISCDWNALTFTLDPKVVNTVYDTFRHLWADGLIYRGHKIASFCPQHQTSFADIEITHKEEKGTMWDIAYPIVGGDISATDDIPREIVISTTRPETLLGDTAVAVNPADERYKDYIGLEVKLPLTDRLIPIIADDYVDMSFGTGAVKITPAHDANDFGVGERHSLDDISVIGVDGKMTNEAGEAYAGMVAAEARTKVIEDLEEQELLRGKREIVHTVGHCYKCGSVIQPLLSDQWFIKVRPLAERAAKALENDEIAFYPQNKKNELLAYFNELRDWNISRQIPWGIAIPAFQNVDDESDWIFDSRVTEESIEVDGKKYKRDEDTFDTWFSSGQWPFIVTDYPVYAESSPEAEATSQSLVKYYPNSVMECGTDLLRPWVAKMIMLGLYATDKVPFKEVYFHGMVQDEHGKKMSKSKGNVISPLEVIAEYGADAFRLGVTMNRSAGQAQAFSKSSVIAGRNLCNKLWNMARFVQDKVGEDYGEDWMGADAGNKRDDVNIEGEHEETPVTELDLRNPAEHWVVAELNEAREELEKLLADYRFAESVELVYNTIWHKVADWFIEAEKTAINPPVMAYVLEQCLKLAHPFMPFVTETIWQSLSWTDDLLADEKWGDHAIHDNKKRAEFGKIMKLVEEIRFVEANIPEHKQKDKLIFGDDLLIAENAEMIRGLAKLDEVRPLKDKEQKKLDDGESIGLRLANSERVAWLDIDEKTIERYGSNLRKRVEETRGEIAQLETRLENEAYVAKAPAELVEESKAILELKRDILNRLLRELGE